MNVYIHRMTSVVKTLLVIGIALVSATVLSSTALAEHIAKAQEQARLNNNCRSVSIPLSSHIHTLLDPATGIVSVEWSVGENKHETDLPIVVNTLCNPGNRALLQKVNQDYTEQVSDTCTEFKQYINGTKSLPEKNGQRGNIVAAQAYVKNHCQ